ncbi:thioredoxin family protein [uncultured Tenacibaculum sp.]|uniref:thioredoxin family protein n=1 Tax=uncultured Tenacibaculum sp. TaxID=174713 RepID=UPI002619266B|nr:thioredoxin family protein [uncultured Tenacibaculum sp.]
MALTESNKFQIGAFAPDFKLINTIDHTTIQLSENKGENGTAIFFICNHCPFVIHINEELVRIANDYKTKGINCIAISSNDIVNYPQDGPVLMKENAEKLQYPFPYLYDETQEVAKAYNAACTPDLYLFDGDLKCVYHGQLDNSRPGNNIPVSGKDLRNAIDALIEHNTILENQKPSIGCNIKWK